MTGMPCVLLGTAILCGCEGRQEKAAVSMPPPVVMVSQPVVREVTEFLEATGNTSPLESVTVQARVKGFLDSMNFQPEQRVKKDQLLFVIDPRPFEVALEQAKGQLQLRQAEAKFAEYDLSRVTKLGAQDAAAEREQRESRAKMEEAQAAVVIAQSAVDEAKLNLDFAHVKAPIAGRISRNLVDVGNLINPGQDQLATITNDDSVYAYFNVSEQDALRLVRIYGTIRRQAASEAAKQLQPQIPVYLALMDEDTYPHTGTIDYVDPRVDPSTGTISARAVFPNPDGFLRAGYFVRIRVPLAKPKPALLVAEQALGMDQGQYYLLAVNDKNKVEYRRVSVGSLENGLRVIERGISPDDRVIVIGLQRVRPGVEVSPQPVPMASVAQVTSRPATPATKPVTHSVAPKHAGH
jgi:membrane fusion protein, multidrug efflux system